MGARVVMSFINPMLQFSAGGLFLLWSVVTGSDFPKWTTMNLFIML